MTVKPITLMINQKLASKMMLAMIAAGPIANSNPIFQHPANGGPFFSATRLTRSELYLCDDALIRPFEETPMLPPCPTEWETPCSCTADDFLVFDDPQSGQVIAIQ